MDKLESSLKFFILKIGLFIIANRIWKYLAIFAFILGTTGGITGAFLQAQIGIDFNKDISNGTINFTTSFRVYHDFGKIVPGEQVSFLFDLNSFFWFNRVLSAHFRLGFGLPFLNPLEKLTKNAISENALVLYEGEFALRFTLLKANIIAMVFGLMIDFSEGHRNQILLSDDNSAYMQASLGAEFEIALALGLEYMLYFRLKIPVSTYNALNGKSLDWGFYPRQGSAELAFLFHKGPSFSVTKATRKVYFGPYYRFDVLVLNLSSPSTIMSHTIGVTYYTKPPF